MSNWIKCTDRLPDLGVKVDICLNCKQSDYMSPAALFKFGVIRKWICGILLIDFNDVTYWRPFTVANVYEPSSLKDLFNDDGSSRVPYITRINKNERLD